MCIAIFKPENLTITKDTLLNCYSHNDDGCGYAFVKEYPNGKNKVIVKKFMDVDKFVKAYKKDEEKYIGSPFIVHFRATSAGLTNLDNCHPFSVNDDQAFIHNGTIYSVPKHAEKSDTAILNETVLQKLPKQWYKNEGIVYLLQDFIGTTKSYSHNKLVFLNSDKSFLIINDKSGIWDQGIWWSNSDYKTRWIPGSYNTGWTNYTATNNSSVATHSKKELIENTAKLETILSATEITREHIMFVETQYANGITLCRKIGDNAILWSMFKEDFYKKHFQVELIGVDQQKNYDKYLLTKNINSGKYSSKESCCDLCGRPINTIEAYPLTWSNQQTYDVCMDCYDFIEAECNAKAI